MIRDVAHKHNVDFQYLRAIRAAENGGPGKEFGVLDGAKTYAEQLAECAATVAHRLESYPANPLVRVFGSDGYSRVIYGPSFISYFASIWAPIDATNDPNHLNRNWYNNVMKAYHQFVQDELMALVEP